MARIESRDPARAGLIGRAAARVSRRQVGRVVEPVTIALHHPRLTLTMGAFEQGLKGAHKLDERLKTLVTLKSASVLGCPFCLDIGSHLARTEGVSDDELHDLLEHNSSDRFSELEKLALDLAVAMTSTPTTVTDEQVARLQEFLSPAQMVELVYTIGWENFRSRTNLAFGLDAAGFSTGQACAVPMRDPEAAPTH